MQTGSAAKGKTARDTKTATDAVKEVLDTVIASLEDSKAEDLLNINIQGKSALGDHMIVASGRSHRHVGAIADHLLRDLKNKGLGTPKTEGLQGCDWVLIDTGDVIVNIFRPEVREFYGLEKMWLVPDQQEIH